MFKKIMGLFVLVLAFGVMPGMEVFAEPSLDQDDTNKYIISNLSDWTKFASGINALCFKGTFDGQGHSMISEYPEIKEDEPEKMDETGKTEEGSGKAGEESGNTAEESGKTEEESGKKEDTPGKKEEEPGKKGEESGKKAEVLQDNAVRISGLMLDNKEYEAVLTAPKTPVSYNGRRHVQYETKLSALKLKKMCPDLIVSVNGFPETVKVGYKYKKNREASQSRAYYYIKLSVNKESVSYNALDYEKKRAFKKELKRVNRVLKQKSSRVHFPINKLDLTEFEVDNTASIKGRIVLRRRDGSGDTITIENENYNIIKNLRVEKKRKSVVTMKISGYEFKAPKNQCARGISGKTAYISGRGKNITGGISVKLE